MSARPPAEDAKAKALERLRERYRATIANTVEAFRQLGAQLAVQPTAPELLETLRREVHRVRGSAGSYGYAEASRLAERIERRVIAWAGDEALEPSQRSVIVGHFAAALELAVGTGGEAGAVARPQRTLLVLGATVNVLEAIRAEAPLRGFRVATLDVAQATSALVRDIAPDVIAATPGAARAAGALAWAGGTPVLLIDDGPAAAPASARVVSLRDGAGALFDAAERQIAARAGTGWTVLAVDDDPSILALVRFVLEGPDLSVATLEDPSRLQETIAEVAPSLLVMDIQMPGHSGIELARLVRGDPATRDLPIVLLSGETDPESRGRAHEAGADEFISKPIAPAQLRARVAAQLERQRAERVSAGLHPATALPMPERLRREAEGAVAELLESRAGCTTVVVAPVDPDGAADSWLRESRRLGAAVAPSARALGYVEETTLLVVLPGTPERAAEQLAALAQARREEAAPWSAGIVGADDLPEPSFDALRLAGGDAVRVAIESGETVRRWRPDDARAAPDVVLVEDDPALSEMLQYALRTTGLTYRAFSNGRVALEQMLAMRVYGRRPFVLLDIDLPGMDGYSLHERLRVERPGDFLVVYITAHSAEPDQLRALRTGAVDFITKPLNLRILMAKMSAWLDMAERRP
jgi:DNA-binding response OmpR family regulator/HPt (histidine-containing phosphotransfer) domain-containing protein